MILGIVYGKELMVVSTYRRRVPEVPVSQAAANANCVADTPILAVIRGKSGPNPEVRLPPAIGKQQTPVPHRQKMRGISLDR